MIVGPTSYVNQVMRIRLDLCICKVLGAVTEYDTVDDMHRTCVKVYL